MVDDDNLSLSVLISLSVLNQDTVDVVRNGMPSGSFTEMMAVLRKFVSFMNLTVSGPSYY